MTTCDIVGLVVMMRIFVECLELPELVLATVSKYTGNEACGGLTSTSWTSSIYAGRGNKNIIDQGKDTFATHPSSILVLDLTIVQHSSLIKLYAPTMNLSRKGDLVRMEVLPA